MGGGCDWCSSRPEECSYVKPQSCRKKISQSEIKARAKGGTHSQVLHSCESAWSSTMKSRTRMPCPSLVRMDKEQLEIRVWCPSLCSQPGPKVVISKCHFQIYLLSFCSEPDTVLGAGSSYINGTQPLPSRCTESRGGNTPENKYNSVRG